MDDTNETLIERFKRYYGDYRQTSDADSSFKNAYEALAYSVIESAGQAAEQENLDAVRDLVREFREIRISVSPSNDSVKERFEDEYSGKRE